MHRLSTEIVDREGKNGSLCGYLFLFLRKQFAEQYAISEEKGKNIRL